MDRLRDMLTEGDRRTTGRADEVAAAVVENPHRFAELFKCLTDEDPGVRMRAADATEKVSASRADLVQPFAQRLLSIVAEIDQQEVQWHVAQIIPRLSLTSRQAAGAALTMRRYLVRTQSNIVKAFALTALVALATEHPELSSGLGELLNQYADDPSPAVRKRVAKLQKQREKADALAE